MGRSRREGTSGTISERGWIERKPLRGEIIEEENLRAEAGALQLLSEKGIELSDIKSFVPSLEGLQAKVQLRSLGDDLVQFRAMLFDDADMPQGKLVRTLDLQKGCAYQNSFSLDNPAYREKGIGLKMFLSHLEFYKKAGIDTVDLYANSEVGGYFWARLGFSPASPGAGAVVRKRLQKKIDELDDWIARTSDPAEISDLRLNKQFMERVIESNDFHALASFRPTACSRDPERKKRLEENFSGKNILLGSGWNAVFDMHSPEQNRHLQEYVSSRNRS